MASYFSFYRWVLSTVFISHVLSITNFKSLYDHSAYLDSTEKYQLHWTVNKAANKVSFAAEVQTTGWIGFGFSSGLSGRMQNADIVIGWVDSNGNGHLSDRFGDGHWLPRADKKQDYKLKKAQETNGKTILHFERNIDTCDDDEDHKLVEGTMKVIWAYSYSDPVEGDESTFKHHDERGARSFNVLNYVTNAPVPSGVKYFDVLQNNVTVPKTHTTYHCMAFRIPDFAQKQHIIEIAPIIQKGNEGTVHHIVVYECPENFPDSHLNTTGSCYSSVMPEPIRKCVGEVSAYAWAIGGGNFKFPNHTGLPIGSKGDIKYIVMETHYDNPNNVAGMKDSSGLRFYYTDKIRKYDAATLYVNHSPSSSMIIPPKVTDWITVGYCPSNTTSTPGYIKSDFPNNAIKIFAAFPHAHLAGRAMWLKHIKADGTEYPEIFRDDNYDFNFQQTSILTEERTFTPGEALNVYCRYNTMDRSSAVKGGLSTYQEMCFFFLLYYPRQPKFGGCSSWYPEITETFSKKYAKEVFKGWFDWRNVKWKQNMVDELKEVYQGKKVSTAIWSPGNKGYVQNDVEITEIKKPFLAPSTVCKTSGCSNVSVYFLTVTLATFIRYSMSQYLW